MTDFGTHICIHYVCNNESVKTIIQRIRVKKQRENVTVCEGVQAGNAKENCIRRGGDDKARRISNGKLQGKVELERH